MNSPQNALEHEAVGVPVGSRRPARWARLPEGRWSDVALAMVLACIGGAIGRGFVADVGSLFFYQNLMPAAVMHACGHGLGEPLARPEALTAFLARSVTAFDCKQLAGIPTQPLSPFTHVHYYLALAVGETWRWMGVSYGALWPIVALLHGAFAAGCFTFARLFVPRLIALVAGVAMTISPVSVSMLFLFRDYAKAPFIVWACVLLVWTLRQHRTMALMLGAALAGTAVGIGRGFRADIVILLPVGVLLLAFGFDRRSVSLRRRSAAIAAFLGFALALMSPTWAPEHGGEGLLIMEGATEPFRKYLGLPAADYDVGTLYSDELVYASAASDLRRAAPQHYDLREESNEHGPPQAVARSTEYVLRWFPLFAADFVTRAIRSGVVLLGFPSALSPPQVALDPFLAPLSHVSGGTVTPWARQIYYGLSHPWLSALGGSGLLALLMAVYARSRYEALAVGFLLAVLLGYPSLQFSSRHFFHLELVFWVAMGSLAWALMRPSESGRNIRAFARPAALVALALALVYVMLGAMQNRLVKREISAILHGPREWVATVEEPAADGRTLFAVALPPEHASITTRVPDLAKSKVGSGYPTRIWSAADRLLVTVGGERCGNDPVSIEFVYTKTPETWQPLDRRFHLALDGGRPVAAMGSAFYRPTQYFRGVAVETARAKCMLGIERLNARSRLPAIFSTVLPVDWSRQDFALKLW